MTTLPERASPLLELTEALDALLAPSEFEGVVVDSLLDQLQEAAEPSGGNGSGSANMYKSPAALDVLALLSAIDKHLVLGLRMSQYKLTLSGKSRAELLRLWASHAAEWRAVKPDYLYESIGEVRRWIIRAQNILTPDPQTIETQAQPCPVCGQRRALVWSEDFHERVQRPSLYLDKTTLTVHCRCCASSWGPRLWSFLRKLLDDNRLTAEHGRSAS